MISKPSYSLEKPDAERDAPFSVAWLSGKTGGETLELMGVVPQDVVSLETETKRFEEFTELEAAKKQVLWVIRADYKSVGVVWINLEDTPDLQAPSLHIMIGDPQYRHKGIGYAVMKDAIRYAYCNLPYATLYSRHLTSNDIVDKLSKKLGFEKDGDTYDDEQGQTWQNIKLIL